MSDEWKEYVNDPRTICKYGKKCYQQNSQHLATYKHPPRIIVNNNRDKRTHRRFSPYNRNEQKTDQRNKGAEQETSKFNDQINKDSESISPIPIPDENAGTIDSENKTLSDLATIETNPESGIKASPSLEPKIENQSTPHQDNITFYNTDTDLSILKELFHVEMPLDFNMFHNCLSTNNTFEKTLSSVNLEPIGPYDLFLGKMPILDDKELYLTHWRFFYDPPEFQAVLKKKGKSEYHIGYFRDNPNEKPVFLGSSDSSKDCHITPIAENIFSAVYLYLQSEKKTSPFTAIACQRLMDTIKKYAEENNISLAAYNVNKRLANVVTKTFHGAGIVVPYNKKTQLGYRKLAETDATIKKLFTKLKSATTGSEKDSVLSEIQPVITYASIAVDECDFGTGIEAGIDLFCSGLKELEPSALSSLTAAYTLLSRDAFSKIIQAHLKYRRRGPNMSVLTLLNK